MRTLLKKLGMLAIPEPFALNVVAHGAFDIGGEPEDWLTRTWEFSAQRIVAVFRLLIC